MALLKFSDYKAQRNDVREAKDKELSNKKFNEKIKSKLEELGVSSMSELSEDQMTSLLDSLKPSTEKMADVIDDTAIAVVEEPIEGEEQIEDDTEKEEQVASTDGKVIDEDSGVMSVKEMCGKVHEMAMMHNSDADENNTYEGYLKECSEMINAMKKVGISETVVNEAKVENEGEFKEYGQSVLKKAFGDKYDEEKANDVIDGISKKVDGDWGAAVGILQASLG